MLTITDNQGKANQGSKREKNEGMIDNNTGLQDCRETGSLLLQSVKCTLVQPLWRTTWQYFRTQTHIPFNPKKPLPVPSQSYSPRCTERLVENVLTALFEISKQANCLPLVKLLNKHPTHVLMQQLKNILR